MTMLDEIVRINHDSEVHQYDYETARVLNAPLVIPRETLKSLERKLADRSGKRMDNKTVYRVTSRDGQAIYLWFHDMLVHIGTAVEEGRY